MLSKSEVGKGCDVEQNNTATATNRTLRLEWAAVLAGALILWDFFTVSAGGYLCAIAYRALVASDHMTTFDQYSNQIAFLGGVLAAIILRDREIRSKFGGSQFDFSRSSRKAAKGILIFVCFLLVIGFLTRILDVIPRLWMMAWIVTTCAATLAGRFLVAMLMRLAIARGVFADRVAIVGSGPAVQRLTAHIASANFGAGLEIVGVFSAADSDPWLPDASFGGLMRLAQQGRARRSPRLSPGARRFRCRGCGIGGDATRAPDTRASADSNYVIL